jgi:MFS family permease
VRSQARAVVHAGELTAWTEPWDGLVRERRDGDGFAADTGPFRQYRRTVRVEPMADGRHRVTSAVTFRMGIPYVGWIVAPLVALALKRPGAPLPWWGPADRIDQRSAGVLGALCLASMVAGYIGTSLTQTLTFAADDFGYDGTTPQSVVIAAARLAVFPAVTLVALADRHGRRRLVLGCATAACLLSATTALAPSLAGYTAAQILTRGASTALGVLIAVMAAEEMPAGARAFGTSVLGMCAALGAGVCVLSLRLADTGESGWRWLFLIPLLALPALHHLRRRLPESKRYSAAHDVPRAIGHHQRLVLLAVSVFLLQLFTTPASQLQNEFLRDERAYSAFAITLFTICTATPAGIGIVIAGRLADVHGRRVVGAIGLVGGVGGTVLLYLSHGPAMWGWSLVASILGGATLPALGVYGPELFPTGARARANGVLVAAALAGSTVGALSAGVLADRLGGLGPALAVLAVGPAILAVLVVRRYPETARLELEDLNPEDQPSSAD